MEWHKISVHRDLGKVFIDDLPPAPLNGGTIVVTIGSYQITMRNLVTPHGNAMEAFRVANGKAQVRVGSRIFSARTWTVEKLD